MVGSFSRFMADLLHPSRTVLQLGPKLPLDRSRITLADQSRTRNLGRRIDNGYKICCLTSGGTLEDTEEQRKPLISEIDTSQYMGIPTFVPSTAQVLHNHESISVASRDLLHTCYG